MIRKYEARDLTDLLAAWSAASEVAHTFLARDFLDQERKNIPEIYLPNAETWVYEAEGRVVGFLSLMGSEVGALFVHPDHHGKGFGRLLMDRAREERGALEVEVFTANSLGRAFYDRYGFEFMERKTHGPTGHELLRLRLPPTG